MKELEMSGRKRWLWLIPACLITVFGCGRVAPQANEDPSVTTGNDRVGWVGQRREGGADGFGRGSPRRLGRGFGRSASVTLTNQEHEALGVETVRASRRLLRSELRVMGSVLAPRTRQAIVSYPFSGRLSAVHVSLGDWVKAGQPVATLQCEEAGAAKAAYHKARTDSELAVGSFERERRLFERGVGAQKGYLAAEAEWKLARAEVASTQKKLHVLGLTEQQIADVAASFDIDPAITLFAPISGKVVQIGPVLGAMVDSATEILTIMDPSVLWVDAEVFERDIAQLHRGQEVTISVPAYPGEIFRGRVSYIGDTVKEETRTIAVRSEVPNGDQRLKAGMFASIVFALREERPVLSLPERALLDEHGELFVFVRAGDEFIPRAVQVGVRHDGFCEIAYGIDEGEEVVVKGNFQLKSKLAGEDLKGHVH
jgi:membrane fusion protein, heavy metal efflux system